MKLLKTTLIVLLSLIAVVVIAASILIWVVFTPEKLTPIVQNELGKLLTCEVQVNKVELTFFSTFPEFGLQIDSFLLKNPMQGAPSDTLLSAEKMVASVDFVALWKNNEVIVNELLLEKPSILVYVDSTGRANYDIMQPMPDDTTAFELPFDLLNLEDIILSEAKMIYKDDGMDMLLSLNDLKANIQLTMKDDAVEGKLTGGSKAFSFYWDKTDYLKNTPLDVETPFTFHLKNQQLQLDKGSLALNKLDFRVDALIQNKPEEILTDIAFNSAELEIKPVINLLWLPFGEYLEGITMNGKAFVNGKLKGTISDTQLPVFSLNVDFQESDFAYEGLPYELFDISGKADVKMDMNNNTLWFVKVDDFDAKTGKSHLLGSAYIDQLMGDMRFDIKANGKLNLVDAKPMLPDDMPIDIQGLATGKANIKFLYSQFEQNQFDKMFIGGKFKVKDLIADYDTISMRSKTADLAFSMPNFKSKQTSFIELDITTGHLDVLMGKHIKADLQGLDLLLSTSNMMTDLPLALSGTFSGNAVSANMDEMTAFINQPKGNFTMVMDMQDSTAIPVFDCEFDMQQLIAAMDTIAVDIAQPSGLFMYHPDPLDMKRPKIQLDYRSERLAARMGQQRIDTKKISVNADVTYDGSQENVLLQWIPKGYVKMEDGSINLTDINSEILIPAIDFDFTPDEYLIRDSRLVIDKSDFQLTGKLSNVNDYLNDKGLLKGDFNFRSHQTDINQLMELTNGIGYEATETEVKDTVATTGTSGPFMVPKGMDINLYASINQALYAKDTARNVQGNITVKDGTLVMESMLFTTSAAKMQLTGMYRTPRKNHLYMGFDLHLLEIEIAELLDLIPDVDSIMPMLRSFSGKGEFHMVVETYLDSLYNLKKSTLRGASSVRGQNLVLMDGETFTEIAKTLRFNKKTENKVDSLSAEFTIFRNEVDVYPFLIVMDKYKAVVEGKHNLDMTFDYHISLTDSPLPIQLGVDVKGNLDDMKIRLAKCKYANMYRPAQRNEVDVKKLELRKLIRDALTAKVREE
jgi:hypothetical protein